MTDAKPLGNPIAEALDLERYLESGDAVQVALGQILAAITDRRAEMRSGRESNLASVIGSSAGSGRGQQTLAAFIGPSEYRGGVGGALSA